MFLSSVRFAVVLFFTYWQGVASAQSDTRTPSSTGRPNFLIAIADDQSFPHASAYGDQAVSTPGFDQVAALGVLFQSAFTPAPGCSPMRAAFLTGREIWQIREAGTHASSFPTDLPVFTNQLTKAGYHVGKTGKGWAPGNAIGWEHNPAGEDFSKRKRESPPGISSNDYSANFDDFLDQRKSDQPFCFWFGSSEPHRGYDRGIGKRNGIDPSSVSVPPFLPDTPKIRNDIADYLYEIQWFDSQLVRMLDRLRETGQLSNTVVIVTSDNGMPFPRAKANLYEYGIHMPLAIAWPAAIPGGQVNRDLVSLLDVTRTIFDCAEVQPAEENQLAGQSLLPRMLNEQNGVPKPRGFVASGRERHSSSRYRSLGYPCRALRTEQFLYIRNFTPERYPAGAPRKWKEVKFTDKDHASPESQLGPMHGGYHDIDGGPSLDELIELYDDPERRKFLRLATDVRPRDELFDIRKDPGCLHNLAEDKAHAATLAKISDQLTRYLKQTGDLRQTDPIAASEQWENYPRFSPLRWFETPPWAQRSPGSIPEQPWLEKRRPR